MTFEYFIKTGELTYDDEWDGDEGFYYDYEVSDKDLAQKLVEVVAEDYDLIPSACVVYHKRENIAKKIVERVLDTDCLDAWVEYYYEDLKDAFEEEAIEEAKEAQCD